MSTPKLLDNDLYLFNEGTHLRLYDKLGAHFVIQDGKKGVQFSVWAPNALEVTVIGDFNKWDPATHRLTPCGSSGIWESFVPGVAVGERYKYRIVTREAGTIEKADPFAFSAETPPNTASVVVDLEYQWRDESWMASRHQHNSMSMRPLDLRSSSWIMDAGPARE